MCFLPPQESLRWKRGRILGKGAYGKVWEGLMDSAKLIAVKEVELDYTSIEKARSVRESVCVCVLGLKVADDVCGWVSVCGWLYS